MRKRNPDQNKLKKFEQLQISIYDIENREDALSHVYFASSDEREDDEYLSMVLKDQGRGKQYAIYVVESLDTDNYRLVYGQKRLYAAIKFELETVNVNVLAADLNLDWDAVNYLYANDFSSRSSYDKGRLFSDLLISTGKKFEVLALETGLPYHTLRSLDSAYKSAQKYPSLGQAYKEEKVHQGIVNLSASLYKQLSTEDQEILTNYLIQAKDDGVERLKNAVKTREDVPIRDRIIGYIRTDADAVAAGTERPEPVYMVAPDDILNPLLPGDEEGASSFTPMYGFNRKGIELLQAVYKKARSHKEDEAAKNKTKYKKISKHVLKFFYLLCRDQLIIIDSENLLILDHLWETDQFPKSAGKYFNNFEKCYTCYKSLRETYPMLFTMEFTSVLPVQEIKTTDDDFPAMFLASQFTNDSEDILFYQTLIDFIRHTSYGIPVDNISSMTEFYCSDPQRVTLMKKMFDTASRYNQAKIKTKNEIQGLMVTI